MKEPERIAIEAHSKSIRKTIADINKLLASEPLSDNSGLRATLRKKLNELARAEARFWYQRGFRRGHRTCAKLVPGCPAEIESTRRMFAAWLPKTGERIRLHSTLSD
jgi:hypothetical protein